MSWFALRTEPQAEWLVVAHLRRHGIAAFLPHWRTVASHARRRVPVKRPVFSRYVFAELDLDRPAPGGWSARSAPGVVGMLHQPIRESEMAELRERTDEGGAMRDDAAPPPGKFRPGDWIEVVKGPFTGSRGVVMRVIFGAGSGGVAIPRRVCIIPGDLAGSLPVTLPTDMVAKAPSP